MTIRESLTTGSGDAFLAANATKVIFRRRLVADDYSIENTRAHGGSPRWLRLMRLGDRLVGLVSTNGTDWSYVWFSTVHMADPVEVGLAVTAHSYARPSLTRRP